MKINILIAICVGFLGYAGTYYFTHMAQPKAVELSAEKGIKKVKGIDVPDFSFQTLDGEGFALSDFADKVVILNFWATWCPPCIKEFPDLLRIAAKYPDDVSFIAVSSDYKAAQMHRFLDKMRTQYGFSENVYVTLDQNNKITQGLYGAYRIPLTLILNREQKAVHKFIGASWTIEEFDQVLKIYR